MSKHMVSSKALCSFYRHEAPQVVFCDGVQDGTVIHLAFSSKTDALAYKKNYCQKNYKDCKIYQMLEKIAEESDG